MPAPVRKLAGSMYTATLGWVGMGVGVGGWVWVWVVASYQALTRNAEEGLHGDTWQNSRMCTCSQHNCVNDYIPYLNAFEITRNVAVGDG